MTKVRLRRGGALYGRQEAAKALGKASANIYEVPGLPPPLHQRPGYEKHEVSTGPLWYVEEIEELVRLLKEAARSQNGKAKAHGRTTNKAKARRA